MRRKLGAALLLAAVVLSACAPWAETHPAAKTVARALQLRSERSRDASAFSELFTDPTVGSALASQAASGTGDPLPAHDSPYVSAAETSGADVIVVWHPAKDEKGWPPATIFKVRLAEGQWRIADALPLEASATPKPMRQP